MSTAPIARVHSARPSRALFASLVAASGLLACSSSSAPLGTPPPVGSATPPPVGATAFVSAAPAGGGQGRASADNASVGGASNAAPPSAALGGKSESATTERKVEETDLYRVEGDRLYYLNAYRGLLVFDIVDVDHPKLVGRSPIFGSPVEMIVRDGVATVVVADWYGHLDNGDPFRGSIVRGIDARDPANIKILGEAKLGGWVRDTRVVGDVIYAVSEDYGWSYGWERGAAASDGASTAAASGPKVIVSSVSFAGGIIRSTGSLPVPGWGGIFNVTKDAILFAHPADVPSATPYYGPSTRLALDYVDISDPGGTIKPRGSVVVDATLISYGTDNGRWNLDFADGKTAHILAQTTQSVTGYSTPTGYVLATADFTNPDAPALASKLAIAGNGWSPAARFDGRRMYLAPADGYTYYGSGPNAPRTPIQVYDLANAAAPTLAGETSISGAVWNFTPAGDRLFILGNEPTDYQAQGYYAGSRISVSYLDVTDATHPTVLGAAAFGEGWAWTPAAGTFKAFTKNDEQKLVVLPFSGWSSQGKTYNNGLQLIEFSPTAITKGGTANTKGWVERGVFAKGRLLSLSDLSLAVIDYSNHQAPQVVSELTLARNVVDARPHGDTIAELSSDWWYGNDVDHSELRVLPTAQADENVSGAALTEVAIEGTNARVFHNGALSYVVSSVRHPIACAASQGGGAPTPDGKGDAATCYAWTQQVQVVEYAGGKAALRGKKELPTVGDNYGYGYPGFGGCYAYDWYYGSDVVQVGSDVLAFRRWVPQYSAAGEYVDALSSLYVVDLANPDEPGIASTVITQDKTGWWGNMRTVGKTLYTSHYEWLPRTSTSPGQASDPNTWTVKYYLDRIDLSDRAHPAVGAKINVPGMLVGGSESDPSLIYTIDYQWYGNHGANDFDVLQLHDDVAELKGRVSIPGYVGSTFVRGNKAYMSVQQYIDDNYNQPKVQLWQLDLTNPQQIVAAASQAEKGWGWLLGVEGDRALVTSGWGSDGIDIYKLSEGAPAFDQFVRTVGWGASSLARQENQIFLASGHWGVQTINLK